MQTATAEKIEPEVIWQPHPGSQTLFLSCPYREVLFEGTRGPGKTDSLLMDFAQHTGQGYGVNWRGILFRETFPQLKEVIHKSRKFFSQIFPDAVYNGGDHCWTWPNGEALYFAYMRTADDYWNYHGHEYPWCIEESTEILMGDSSTKEAKFIQAGEFVMTLEGPKRVLKKKEIIKPAVEISFFDDGGDKLGSQIQGLDHQILSTEGMHNGLIQGLDYGSLQFHKDQKLWLGYKSLQDDYQYSGLDVFFLRNLKSFERSNFDPAILLDYSLKLLYSSQIFQRLFSTLVFYKICKLILYYYLKNQVDSVSLINGNKPYKVWPGEFQVFWRLFQYGNLPVRELPSLRNQSKEADYGVYYVLREALIQGFLYYLLFCQNYNDELFLQDQGNDLNISPLPGGYGERVLIPLFDMDGLGTARTSAHFAFYTHPYSGESRPSFYTSFSTAVSFSFSLLKSKRLIDFTISDSSHYISKIKRNQLLNSFADRYLINKNCGFEELTNWKNADCYESMKACNRSSHPGMPRKYRSTANPYGKGHSWLKEYFKIDTVLPNTPIIDEGKKSWVRCRIKGYLVENLHLMKNDPDYVETMRTIKDPNLRKAWWEGSWDIIAGGALTDVWDERTHYIPPFHIPTPWYVNRSFDWGSSSPFSVCWWAESNGCEVQLTKKTTRIFPRGSIFHIAELYGWNGESNKGSKMHASAIAKKILEREAYLPYNGRVRPGPADKQIFASDRTIATDMTAAGVKWTQADMGPGSRVAGLEAIRSLLWNSMQKPMEDPGLFIFNTCPQWRRTVPGLPRDERDMDDVDTDTEDHCYDGETLIETDKGLFRIKDMIGTTGKILTVGNYWIDYFDVRKTRNNVDLVKVEFENDESIICTDDEVFLTTDLRLKRVLDLCDETCYSLLNTNYSSRELCKSEKLAILYKSLMESDIINAEIIFPQNLEDYIEMFGITIMVQLIKDLRFIIKMKINQIIKLITLNLCYQKNTSLSMQKNFIKMVRSRIGLKQCMKGQGSGMVVLKEENGIESSLKNIVDIFLKEQLQNIANNVANLMNQGIQIKRDFVQDHVAINGEGYQELIMKLGYVSNAKKSLKLINMRRQDFVQSLALENIMQKRDIGIRVKSVTSVGQGDVYCLIADGIHLFAIGKSKIIASNCYDATRYRILTRKIKTTIKEV